MICCGAGYPFHPAIYMRFQALLAVVAIDGRPLSWPRPKKSEIERLLARFTTGDLEAITNCYRTLNTNEPPPPLLTPEVP